METSASRALLTAIVLTLAGCAASVSPGDGSGGSDAPTTGACAPGTCRFSSSAGGPCLPPGGPIGRPDGGLSGCCACGADGLCSSPCLCAAPDTPIATPSGPRAMASLAVGDEVYSVDHGHVTAVPIRAVQRNPVAHHLVVRVVLDDGTVLQISAAHPTADGRSFGDLRAGDWLGGRGVASAAIVPYAFDATYDILPASDTGAYFAGGALIGSTLAPTVVRGGEPTTACLEPTAATTY